VVAALAVVPLAGAGRSAEGQTPAPAPQRAQSGAVTEPFDPIATRITYLHDRLRITSPQEPLWATVAQAIRDNAQDIAPLLRERLQTARTGNALEIFQSYQALGAGQLANLRRIMAAFEPLYADLTPTQKKIADAILREGVLSTLTGGIPVTPAPLGLPPAVAVPTPGAAGAPLAQSTPLSPPGAPSALGQPNLPRLGSQVIGPSGFVGTVINRAGNTATVAPIGGGAPGTYVPNGNGTATIFIPGQAPVVVPAR
jgi:periplasmic protein CpxP/Spy